MILKLIFLLEALVYLYLAFSTIYLFVFAFAGIFKIKKNTIKETRKRKMIVLIPGYREDEVIVDVAKEALKQDYGTENYDVAIIADGFLPETIEKLSQINVKVFEVKLEFSTKSRALNAALDQLDDSYDVAVILDADNIMETRFLTKVNEAFCAGYQIVQGHRIAKNMDTSFAILDAVSEEMNNHIFRKGHWVLGFSSSLIGSAMAFDYQYFKSTMREVKVVGGFDKELEVRLLKEKKKIVYLPDAYVYDEKVPNAKVFTKQRRRWISAQIHYFGKSFIPAFKELIFHGNIDLFNKALQFILLPRILLISILFIISLAFLILAPASYFLPWIIIFVLCLLVFVLSIPGYFYNFRTLWAITRLPLGIFLTVLSVFRFKGGNKEYLHTKHTYNAFQIKHPWNRLRK
ncbi:MAG: glycosyltransferase [Bacteroidales bacterium]|nr:glycosyltransferase [Bacteroidales bacterium]